MSPQTVEIVQVDDARGMVPGFHFVSAENAFDGDAQKAHHFLRSMLERGLSSNFTFLPAR